MTHSPYIGRFAPSPSGPLHFGSLVAALGSYLRARKLGGKWLVRMEDLDPPREVKGAAKDILSTLERFGFEWDDDVLYQSQRQQAYQALIDQYLSTGQAYYCQCTRKQIQARGGVYDGQCAKLAHPLYSGAIRIKNTVANHSFVDGLMGNVCVPESFAREDFIIKRSDRLYAYQLAVVLDDHQQGITEIVRGCDLLEASCRQISLYQLFGYSIPEFIHLPLACTKPGLKLSKQNHADAVAQLSPQIALNQALTFLGQQAVDTDGNMASMLSQAIDQFDLYSIPNQSEILIHQ
ncbi:tRNA glutamyl-Q(34) synthetase GluQRS [Shewanella gelidii]|uniref:Glutamyl-Q tRNA(Asp) synthetase n=1 Tax=Shewanella gelidii TaxID=1642821 RepID=A0A917JJ88_9GAMM|nr:tRNA glutamyl-Q(34) synthetase GluQRS [Shewanella gelidii]MCL1096870.1 tRNA glutamyl-Q(34) synthetase GluQRS [Shewanella gelidii]GGI70773.1 glutamyl-Q tRNA(Asp) synthetase [Shewanella gelidii]